MKELIIEARLENMEKVLAFINSSLGDCPPKTRKRIAVVVDEIFSNIARYAYHPKDGDALIRITVDDGCITIEFEDSGIAYDPLATDDPDTSLSAEEREIGGLGIYMVKNMMDSVSYRHEANKNILTIQTNYSGA